jgi:hypothetical protein
MYNNYIVYITDDKETGNAILHSLGYHGDNFGVELSDDWWGGCAAVRQSFIQLLNNPPEMAIDWLANNYKYEIVDITADTRAEFINLLTANGLSIVENEGE